MNKYRYFTITRCTTNRAYANAFDMKSVSVRKEQQMTRIVLTLVRVDVIAIPRPARRVFTYFQALSITSCIFFFSPRVTDDDQRYIQGTFNRTRLAKKVARHQQSPRSRVPYAGPTTAGGKGELPPPARKFETTRLV